MSIRIVYKLVTMKNNFRHYDTILDIIQPYGYLLPNKGDYINLCEKKYRVDHKEFNLNEQNGTFDLVEIILTD